MKLTEKKAIQLSIKLWTWLYDNPEKHKSDWPLYEKYGLYDMKSSCFCCQYYYNNSNNEDIICKKCPLNTVKLCKNGYGDAYNDYPKLSRKDLSAILKSLQKRLDKIIEKGT